eukprot:gnl/TRDRNA2_/TRDRNA2_177450_c1_seq1.p1 gnl/TRDRNA2_/TRDRNA2_177450_c1~~gnl/TRDRNA2_/TRDRNA2_177450_c1_seq1.p1  ORF type:complete len:344 (+),score=52.58 gnl/TRDRNA2_/TRDRNA2_177450_c1_seq1:83-1033(+)
MGGAQARRAYMPANDMSAGQMLGGLSSVQPVAADGDSPPLSQAQLLNSLVNRVAAVEKIPRTTVNDFDGERWQMPRRKMSPKTPKELSVAQAAMLQNAVAASNRARHDSETINHDGVVLTDYLRAAQDDLDMTGTTTWPWLRPTMARHVRGIGFLSCDVGTTTVRPGEALPTKATAFAADSGSSGPAPGLDPSNPCRLPDAFPDCAARAAQGECFSKAFRKKCCYSCNCQDQDVTGNCQTWAANGQCRTEEARRGCRRTCKYCVLRGGGGGAGGAGGAVAPLMSGPLDERGEILGKAAMAAPMTYTELPAQAPAAA